MLNIFFCRKNVALGLIFPVHPMGYCLRERSRMRYIRKTTNFGVIYILWKS